MSTGPTKTLPCYAWLKFCFPARIFDDEPDDDSVAAPSLRVHRDLRAILIPS
jgi:hypothetical protein